MSAHTPRFQSFFRILHHFVLTTLATSNIRVNIKWWFYHLMMLWLLEIILSLLFFRFNMLLTKSCLVLCAFWGFSVVLIAYMVKICIYRWTGLIRKYRFQGLGPSKYIYIQIPVLITDNLIRTSPKPDDFWHALYNLRFKSMLSSGLPFRNWAHPITWYDAP